MEDKGETTNPDKTRPGLRADAAELAERVGSSKSEISSSPQINLDEVYVQAAAVASKRLAQRLALAQAEALATSGQLKEARATLEELLREVTQAARKAESTGDARETDGYLGKGVEAGNDALLFDLLLKSRPTTRQS